MLSSPCLRVFRSPASHLLSLALVLALVPASSLRAQQTEQPPAQQLPGQTSQPAPAAGKQAQKLPASLPQQPAPVKPPALVDPAGPAISLQTSEAVFDIAVALNVCGYDDELASSDPIRQHVREQVNQALVASDKARDARDGLCAYISEHRLAEPGRDLAQYISLALYITPPPELAPSVELTEMPPDSTQVVEVLPLVREFEKQIDLHAIWVNIRPAYDELIAKLHDPLTKMIVNTNFYLKMPTSTYDGRRFLVVLEPMLAPSQTNARVYGLDYVVVASPVNGTIHMTDVRHTYLHYEIEPLLFARASAMDRLLPILKTVRDAPLDFTYKSDIVALVIECMIRAIEARTMDTGVPEYKAPAEIRRADLERVDRERNAYQQKVAAIRQAAVNKSMAAGYVLTQYFYDSMISFEHQPASLKESIGEMVYGMDVDVQVHRAKDVEFVAGDSDVLRRAPRQLRGLDLAEMKLIKGDAAGAGQIAQQALEQKSGDPGEAHYVLARAALLQGHIDDAQQQFEQTIKVSKNLRTLAWSHIYIGRIYDVQEDRDNAVAEYKAALTVRDGQADTRQAAEKGIKQPFELPHHASRDEDDNSDSQSAPKPPAAQPHS
jgi:tetratricopeptide (TPR) repeat protein